MNDGWFFSGVPAPETEEFRRKGKQIISGTHTSRVRDRIGEGGTVWVKDPQNVFDYVNNWVIRNFGLSTYSERTWYDYETFYGYKSHLGLPYYYEGDVYHTNYLSDGSSTFQLWPEAEPRGTKSTWDVEAVTGPDGPHNYRTHNFRLWQDGLPTDYKLDYYHAAYEIPQGDFALGRWGRYANQKLLPDTYQQLGKMPGPYNGHVDLNTPFFGPLSKGQLRDHMVDRDMHNYAIRYAPGNIAGEPPEWVRGYESLPLMDPRPEALDPIQARARTTPAVHIPTRAERKIGKRLGLPAA